MSYYILPKINENIDILPIDSSSNKCELCISYSLFNYYNQSISEIERSIKTMNKNTTEISTTSKTDLLLNNYKNIYGLVNPYEFIFSRVPGSKYSVSKLKPTTCLFYDFLEISVILDIFEPFKDGPIQSLHITNNYNDINECFEMIREDYSDKIMYFDEVNDENIRLINDQRFHFLFLETKNNDLNTYIISMMEYVMIILKYTEIGGTCIIKFDHIFHKPIIDMLYFLSSLFEKVYILKPNTSNITTFEKYIICKGFQANETKLKNLKLNYYRILVFLKKLENRDILSVIDISIPYYFTIKINDINNIIGQQQLESLDLIMNTLKNKNKDDKIELIQKSNIQKSVAWCEKYKIPCNKFFEKTNIFLPIIKEPKPKEYNDNVDTLEYVEIPIPDIEIHTVNVKIQTASVETQTDLYE